MKSFFLLQSVLVWTVIAADFKDFLQKTELTGNIIQEAKAPDAGYCQRLCSFTPQCTHFSFIPTSFRCSSKFGDAQPKKNNNVVSGYAIPASEIQNYKCYEKLFNNISFKSLTLLLLQKNTVEECLAACDKYNECQFFTYHLERNWCCLKYTTILPNPPEIKAVEGLISGFSLSDCPADKACDGECTEMILNNIGFHEEAFETVQTPDVERCQIICSNNPRCNFFTFAAETDPNAMSRFTCSLIESIKELPLRIVTDPHFQAGFPLRTIRSHKTCTNKVYNNIDFPGNDQRELKVQTYEECQQACTADTLCQFWTFEGANAPQADLQNTCYLKTVAHLPSPNEIVKDKVSVSGFSQSKCT